MLDPGFAASLLVPPSLLVADRGDSASPLACGGGQLQACCRGTGSSGLTGDGGEDAAAVAEERGGGGVRVDCVRDGVLLASFV